MKRCPFCHRMMDLVSGYGALRTDHFVCPGCGLEWIFGIHKLPDPDKLRAEADELQDIADEIEAGEGLAGRIRRALA